MPNPELDHHISRRRFLRHASCAALGYAGIVNTLSHLTLVHSAVGQGLPGYKALVVLFLAGGNDSNNMLIPRMGHPAYTTYKNSRGALGIYDPNDGSVATNAKRSIPITTSDGSYGLHHNMQKVVDLFNGGDLSFVANIGSLAHPILDREEFLSGSVPLPPQLYSHSNQQLQWQSSLPDQPFQSGWGGRIADLLSATPSDSVAMGISLAGINKLQVGMNTAQYAIGVDGTISLSGYGGGYSQAVNPDGSYKNTVQGIRLKAFDDVVRHTHENLLEESYNTVVRSGRDNEAIVGAAEAAANASGVNFNALFGAGSTGLSPQLRMIAKLIAGRNVLGNSRQIFFASVSGYDTHASQLPAHENLMTELSDALKSFRDAMVQLGVHNDVLTMTHSDFSRTLSPNKPDGTSGTDHGWGGHHLVMGGGVHGGRIFGHFPNLMLGGTLDTNTNRGRFIPTTSVDQYVARAASWFGVGSSEMATIFPNLERFDDPFGGTANLAYI